MQVISIRAYSVLDKSIQMSHFRWPTVATFLLCAAFLAVTASPSGSLYYAAFTLYIVFSLAAIIVCIFCDFSHALTWLAVLIAYEPITKELLVDLGGSFTMYTITLCMGLLALRRPRFNILALLMLLICIVFAYHAVSFVLYNGITFSMLASKDYRVLVYLPTLYLGGCFTTIVFSSWNPDRHQFMYFTFTTVMSLAATILVCFVWQFYIDSFQLLDVLRDWRFDFIGDVGANSTGLYLLVTITLLLVYSVGYPRNVTYAAIITAVCVLVLTRSRYQIFFMLTFLPFVFYLLYPTKKRIFVLLSMSNLLIIVFIFLNPDFMDFLGSLLRVNDEYIGMFDRGYIWILCLKLFQDNPIFGVDYFHCVDFVAHTPHNPHIGLMAYTGIVGGGSFLVVTIIIFRRIYTSWNQIDPIHKAISLVSIATIIGSMTVDIWYYWYFFFFFFGLIKVHTAPIDRKGS